MGRKQEPGHVTKADYFVYIGPTIRSIAQHNSIIQGDREQVLKKLAGAIEKYPPIAQLLIGGNALADARKQIKQPGNRLYVAYRKLIGLLNQNGG